MSKPVDLTRPVQTREGLPVRILCTNRRGGGRREIVGLVTKDGSEDIAFWYLDGSWLKGSQGKWDLVNVPPQPIHIAKWVNVYKNGNTGYNCFDSEFEARNAAGHRVVTTVRLTGEYIPEE